MGTGSQRESVMGRFANSLAFTMEPLPELKADLSYFEAELLGLAGK